MTVFRRWRRRRGAQAAPNATTGGRVRHQARIEIEIGIGIGIENFDPGSGLGVLGSGFGPGSDFDFDCRGSFPSAPLAPNTNR